MSATPDPYEPEVVELTQTIGPAHIDRVLDVVRTIAQVVIAIALVVIA